jgi:hypothetical protein
LLGCCRLFLRRKAAASSTEPRKHWPAATEPYEHLEPYRFREWPAFRSDYLNWLVYRDDKEFAASLPAELQPALQRHFARFGLDLADYGLLFEHLHAAHHNKERVKIQLAPANLHWCSDAALEMLAGLSARYEAPMHMHLVETAW